MNGIPTSAEVRAEVNKILAHPAFAASARLCAFLRFVVEEELAGRGPEIKEYVIGVQVYRKSETYDPRTDPAVRVDAGKLRARLAEYYETDGRNDPVLISIPKGTYVPRFESRVPEIAAPSPASQLQRLPRRLQLLSLCALPTIAIGVWGTHLLLRNPPQPPPASRTISLTSDPGEQYNPSLSPDGSMVAFSWNGPKQDNYDIYVKVVDAPGAIRLTIDPARDTAPAWSPDGRQIAFIRNPGPTGEVYVVSALGGPERRIASSTEKYASIGWTADSRALLITDRSSTTDPYAGFQVSLETGERKQLTFPPPGSLVGDYDFVASPDGSTIVFCRMVHAPVAELWRLPAAGGPPEKLSETRRFLLGLAWTPDSRGIVFSSEQSDFPALWIMPAQAHATPSLLQGVETGATRPSIPARAAVPDRIAYQRSQQTYRLWRSSVSGRRMLASSSIAPSQQWDAYPQISPDSTQLVFGSTRAGSSDIWACDLDGGNLKNLTSGSGIVAGAPRWSPDGKAITFDGYDATGHFDIYRMPAGGGPIQRLTSERSESVRPSWSADGRWVYFTSDRTGRREIWKMPSAGGPAVRVTATGGFECYESPDGRTLYFLKTRDSTSLWRMPTTGGEEALVHEGVREGRWTVTDTGIYFIDPSRRLCALESDGAVVCLGTIDREGPDARGLTVSRGGREIVYVQPEPARSDLRMTEGRLFR
jgi:Tol biopolymer transport system component